MTAPLYETGALGAGGGLVVALGVGIAFGYLLERAGLGNARKLSAQFRFADFAVLKVMFSAIVTAALGVFWLSRMGALDLTRVYVPETYLLPQLAGGALFSQRALTALVESGMTRDISPGCRETSVRDVLNQNTASPTNPAAAIRQAPVAKAATRLAEMASQ